MTNQFYRSLPAFAVAMFLITLSGCSLAQQPLPSDAGTVPMADAGTTPMADSGPVPTPDAGPMPVDNDGDGFNADVDCDDDSSDVHPGAEEVCNGIDNDCDGEVDEGCPTCETTPETCDSVDNDCDGLLDEGGICPQWQLCSGERADYLDLIVESVNGLGDCAGGHWAPKLLLNGGAWTAPGGGNLVCEPLGWYWDASGFGREEGAYRVGFQCSSDGRWLVNVPDGTTAEDMGVTVNRYFGGCGASDTVEHISATTTWVYNPVDDGSADNGTRLQVYLHSGCSHSGG